MPAIAAGIGAVTDLVGSLFAPVAAAATDVAPALGFAGDVAGTAAADTGALGGIDAALASAAGTGAATLPEITVTPELAGAAGTALDLGGAASAPLDLLGGAGAAAGAGTGLSDVLGAGALGSALGNALVGPASVAEAPAGGTTTVPKTTLGASGGATGGGAGPGAGASAASAAAPANANNVVSGDFGALGYATPSSPGAFPTTSPSGQPLATTATDPTAIGGAGTSGGYDLSTIGPGVSATGGALGDNAVTALGAPTALTGGGATTGGLPGLLGSAGSWVANNPLMAAALGLGGGELLNNLLNPPKLPYQQQQEQIASEALNNAGALQAQGQQDVNYETSGTLPPGLAAQVQSALQAANAATQSRYASLGLGNSTMLQDALNNNQLQSQALAGTLQQQLAQTGTQLISNATSDLSVASQVYSGIMQAQISQDNQLEASVTQFAGSLALASAIGSKTATPKAA